MLRAEPSQYHQRCSGTHVFTQRLELILCQVLCALQLLNPLIQINSHQLADSASTLLGSVLAVCFCFLAT